MARVLALRESGAAVEALGEAVKARRNKPFDGRGLASDEALALAETWEFQAAYDLSRGWLEAGLEDLAIAEQILETRPEHGGHRGQICAEIASRLPADAPGLASVKAEYLAIAAMPARWSGSGRGRAWRPA
ncbi:MAG TPA: hypothetical protein VHV09_13900 [Trebonia sp.]|jgi:hypothetical protein|nr:hypothetical protein [Trebonia sp.]